MIVHMHMLGPETTVLELSFALRNPLLGLVSVS